MFATQTSSRLAARSSGTPLRPRDRMIAEIKQVVGACSKDVDCDLAEVLAKHVTKPRLLDKRSCTSSEISYTRHNIYSGEGFSVLAVVWRPGQMSPVHGHHTWCALGVVRGVLTEAFYRPTPRGWEIDGCVQRRPGDVSHSKANALSSHRVANLGTQDAISIHVYGIEFDAINYAVNDVRAP